MPHIQEAQLSAYLDGQLPAQESGLIESHLRECDNCCNLLEEMRDVTQLFRNAEQLEPSPFLWTRIAAGFENSQNKKRERGWVASALAGMRRFGWYPGIAAATFGILMFVGIAIFKETYISPAALAAIDRAGESLALENADTYNPFSSGSPSDFDTNPFRSVRLSGKTSSAPLRDLQR